MFNQILIPFNYENHIEYSAFHQVNIKSHDELLSELDAYLKYCHNFPFNTNCPVNQFENTNRNQDVIITSSMHRIDRRLIILPPLYSIYLKIAFDNLTKSPRKISFDYIDILFHKKILTINENSEKNKFQLAMSEADYLCQNLQKIGLLEDRFVKTMVSNRAIDVVITIDSFVKLVLCYLKKLKENCYLPFLKINVTENERNCIIFDEDIIKTNKSREKKRYLKQSIIRRYSLSHSSNQISKSRVTNSNYGSIGSQLTSLFDFSRDTVNLGNSKSNILTEGSSISSTKIENNWMNDIDKNIKENLCYSYGLWKLMDCNVLFRFKNFVQPSTNEAECENYNNIYTRFQMKGECQDDDEEVWKSFIGSKINLDSDILKIIIDAEKESIDSVISKSFAEFNKKYWEIEKQFFTVSKALANLFGELRNSQSFEPDYYLLQGNNDGIISYKSTNDKNANDIDLREIMKF